MKAFLVAIFSTLIFLIAIRVDATSALTDQSVSTVTNSDSNQDMLIEQLLVASGMEKSLKRLPEQIISGFRQSIARSEQAPAEKKEMLKIYTDAYPVDGFVNRVRGALKRNYDQKRYASLLQLLSTPLSNRMAELEAIEPSAEEFRTFMLQVASQPLSPQRIQLIQRMDSSTGTSAMLSKVTIATIESNAIAMVDDCSGNTEKIKKMIDEKRPTIEKTTHNSAQVMLAFTYRDVSDAELNEYLKTSEEKDSKWVQDFVQAAIEEQFDSSIEKEAKGMRQFVQAHKPKKTMFAPKCE